ncbi:hypothetical protein HMPREF1410_00510 [Helicobacter pylori GAM249T]|nr:hypothetical protein HMPREF1410_00510 [Helicobacter pylori GAM249T]
MRSQIRFKKLEPLKRGLVACFTLHLKRFQKTRRVALIFHKELGGGECKGLFYEINHRLL